MISVFGEKQKAMFFCFQCITPFLVFLYSKHMNTYIEDILSRIQDLLELTPPVSDTRAHT